MARTMASTRTTIWTWTDRSAVFEGIVFSMAEFEAFVENTGVTFMGFSWQDYETGLGRYKKKG